MVNGLSGTFVATANGINEMRKGGEMAKGAGQRATDAAAPRVAQAASAVGAARNALPGGRVAAALQDAKTTQAAMKEGRSNIGKKNAERGKVTSRAERREAGQAAMIQMARQNAQGRAMVNADGAGGKDDEAKKKLVQQTVQSASKRKGA